MVAVYLHAVDDCLFCIDNPLCALDPRRFVDCFALSTGLEAFVGFMRAPCTVVFSFCIGITPPPVGSVPRKGFAWIRWWFSCLGV